MNLKNLIKERLVTLALKLIKAKRERKLKMMNFKFLLAQG